MYVVEIEAAEHLSHLSNGSCMQQFQVPLLYEILVHGLS